MKVREASLFAAVAFATAGSVISAGCGADDATSTTKDASAGGGSAGATGGTTSGGAPGDAAADAAGTGGTAGSAGAPPDAGALPDATPLDYVWDVSFGSTENGFSATSCGDLESDKVGNVFLTGIVDGTSSFGGQTYSAPTQTGLGIGFVASWSAAGKYRFDRAFWPQTSSGDIPVLAVDGSGRVAVSGYFGGTLDFGGGDKTTIGGIFVAAYDASGGYRWDQVVSLSYVLSAAADAAGNIVVGGYTMASAKVLAMNDLGTAQWEDASLPYVTASDVATDGSGNFFAAFENSSSVLARAYTPSGALAWSYSWDPNQQVFATKIAASAAGNVFVVGSYTVFESGVPQDKSFLVALDSSGNHLWNLVTYDHIRDLAVDPDGNVVLVGTLDGPSDHLGPSTVYGQLPFVAAYTPQGTFKWGDLTSTQLWSVAVDPSGNVLLCGGFGGPTDFGGGVRYGHGVLLKVKPPSTP